MPLAEVRAGMQCTALSVVRGTEISSFDVEVLDTLAPVAGLSGPRILIRVSGPAVDETGVGPGFSGSPIYCDGRNAGAISEGIGAYGNFVVLATPIEEILSEQPVPTPASARRDGRLARAARPLTAPLTASGLGPRSQRLLADAARRAGRTLLAAPGGPLGGFPPQELRPGAAVAAGLASGDFNLGAIGTVAYRDGERVWAFGHPLDEVGPRALFMQDAYVFSVDQQPARHPRRRRRPTSSARAGATPRAASPTTRARPRSSATSAPSRPRCRCAWSPTRSASTAVLNAKLADERAFGLGVGLSLLGAARGRRPRSSRPLRSLAPAHTRLCARFFVRDRKRPLGFCNGYVSTDAALVDLSEAGALVEGFDLPTLPLTRRGVEAAGATRHAERRDRRRPAAVAGASRARASGCACACAGAAAARRAR